MESNHRFLDVGQVSSPLDHGTEQAAVAGVEPAIPSLTGSSLTVGPTPQKSQDGGSRTHTAPVPEAGGIPLSDVLNDNRAPSGSRTRTACMGSRQATLTSWVHTKKAGRPVGDTRPCRRQGKQASPRGVGHDGTRTHPPTGADRGGIPGDARADQHGRGSCTGVACVRHSLDAGPRLLVHGFFFFFGLGLGSRVRQERGPDIPTASPAFLANAATKNR